MAKEIELKYLIDPQHLAQVANLPEIKFLTTASSSKRLISTYYDTPELSLKAAKAAFRIRKAGDQWIQTVKAEVKLEGGLSTREEVEHQLAENKPDFNLLAQSPFANLFVPPLTDQLQAAFVTDFQRQALDLGFEDGTIVELAIDQGKVIAGSKEEDISEIELELKQGSSDTMLAFAKTLTEKLPLEPGTASKAKRGYALAAN